jgi:hypothetical protein
MRLIKTVGMAGVLGVVCLGTMAMAQKGGGAGAGGGGGASHPISTPNPVNSTNNTNSSSTPMQGGAYNNSVLGYPWGDSYFVNGNSALAQQQRLKAAEQYRRLNQDTDKIVNLTKELKTGVDSQPQGQLPVDMAKKVNQIEKLAKDLQNQLKD